MIMLGKYGQIPLKIFALSGSHLRRVNQILAAQPWRSEEQDYRRRFQFAKKVTRDAVKVKTVSVVRHSIKYRDIVWVYELVT